MAASSNSGTRVSALGFGRIPAGAQRRGAPLGIDTIWIDNTARPARSGKRIDVVDPATEAIVAHVSRGDRADVAAAAASARAALHGPWSALSPQARGELLLRLADELERNAEAFALLETTDVGKPISAARGDVSGAATTLRYNAGAADKIEGITVPLGPDFLDYTELEPLGVTAHITPWNFPLGMAIRSVAPALAAGCTVVVKPSEHASLSTSAFAEILPDAGFPPGVVNIVSGYGPEAGEALVTNPDIDSVTFTGSVATGGRIGELAGKLIKPAVLELGGKNPFIVFEDAALETAVETALEGAFDNSGQVCSSVSRLVLHEKIAAKFLDRFVAAAAALTIGPGGSDPNLGPLVSAEQFDKVRSHIDEARDNGARFLLDGDQTLKKNGPGFFVAPTIVENIDVNSRLATEETFGPVVTVFRFSSEDEAVEIANSLPYGLVAGIHTREIGRATRLARRLDAGSVWINGWFIGGVQAPTGGVKLSGIGRERGLEGVRNYLRIKNIGVRLLNPAQQAMPAATS